MMAYTGRNLCCKMSNISRLFAQWRHVDIFLLKYHKQEAAVIDSQSYLIMTCFHDNTINM
jgi:hypothetical protein